MKWFSVKVVSLAAALMVLFTAFLALPVSAAGDVRRGGTEWWDHGDGSIIDFIIGVIAGEQNDFGKYSPDKQSASAFDFLLSYIDYHTGSSVNSISAGGAGSSGGRGSTSTAYQSGSTVSTPIVESTYSNTTNNYSYKLNIPTSVYNNTTNNYYEQYDITNIYKTTNYNTYDNRTYNTFNFEVTNNYTDIYNYYVTYAPTFVNITYLDSAKGEYNSNYYFYQLPDGRNSWDLTADEVFGMYFLYDAVNYDMVVEDAATLALYHFDGDMKDESANGGTASYSKGASYNYVDHSVFGSALYWDSSEHQLNFSGMDGGGTYELLFYPTQGGTFATTTLTWKYQGSAASTTVRDWDYFFDMANPKILHIDEDPLRYTNNYSKGTYTYTHILYYVVGYVLNVGGTGYFPVVDAITILETTWKDFDGYSSISGSNIAYKGIVRRVVYGGDGGTVVEMTPGTWQNLAMSGGQGFLNGSPVNALSGASDISGTALYMPQFGNYTMIDEFRISAGTLFSGSYVPSQIPYDTNKVMVLPEGGDNGNIAVKSSAPVGEMRVGGARPTYPVVGDVFIPVTKSENKHVAGQAQQYQHGGWVEVDAAIMVNGEWLTLKNYDLRTYTVDEGDFTDPNGDGSTSGGDTSGTGDGDSDGESWWEKLFGWIGDLLGGIISGLISLVLKLVEGVITLISSLFDILFNLADFATNFGSFMGEAFAFIPSEIISIIVLGLILAIILMIVRFIRG